MLRYDLTLLLRNHILTKWATLELLTLELLLLTQLRTTRSTTLTTSGWDLFSFSRYFFVFSSGFFHCHFQAILFYLPRHLWKTIEGGKVRFCTKDMKEPELDDETRSIRVTR